MAIMLGKPMNGSGNTLVLHVPDTRDARKPYQRWSLVCFGNKRHYRKDGTCGHTEALLSQLRPWYRSRTHLTPFGAKEVAS
jgi:hypothetical protein